MKINLTKKDIIWSYIGTIMSMGANLLMLPFIMYFLEESMLGLWYVFASIGAVATLFDFGFAVTFARNITYCWSGARQLRKENVNFIKNLEPDYVLMKQVLATCKVIYGILASGALFLLLTAGTTYVKYVSREIVGSAPVVAWLIYAIAIYLNLYYGYYASFLRGVGAIDRANKNTVYARSVQIIITIILLAAGTGIIGACIAYLAYGTSFRLLGKYYFYKYEGIGNHLKKIDGTINKKQLKYTFSVVWYNAWRDGAISVCNYFCNQASTLICSMYLPLAQTGIYSIGVQIASAITQIAGTLYNAYQPELQSSYINGNKAKMCDLMSMIVMSFIYLCLVGIVGFTAVGLPLLRLAKPSAVISVPVLLGLCTYQFMLKFRNCYTSYFSCTNRIIYVNGFIVSAILCVIISFIMIGPLHLGIWGLIVAQIISQGIYNVWHWPIKAHKELGLSAKNLVVVGTKETVKMVTGFYKNNQ